MQCRKQSTESLLISGHGRGFYNWVKNVLQYSGFAPPWKLLLRRCIKIEGSKGQTTWYILQSSALKWCLSFLCRCWFPSTSIVGMKVTGGLKTKEKKSKLTEAWKRSWRIKVSKGPEKFSRASITWERESFPLPGCEVVSPHRPAVSFSISPKNLGHHLGTVGDIFPVHPHFLGAPVQVESPIMTKKVDSPQCCVVFFISPPSRVFVHAVEIVQA